MWFWYTCRGVILDEREHLRFVHLHQLRDVMETPGPQDGGQLPRSLAYHLRSRPRCARTPWLGRIETWFDTEPIVKESPIGTSGCGPSRCRRWHCVADWVPRSETHGLRSLENHVLEEHLVSSAGHPRPPVQYFAAATNPVKRPFQCSNSIASEFLKQTLRPNSVDRPGHVRAIACDFHAAISRKKPSTS